MTRWTKKKRYIFFRLWNPDIEAFSETVKVEQLGGGGRLAIHKREPPLIEGNNWAVTHIPTGLGMAYLSSRRNARRYYNLMKHLDWEFKHKEDMPEGHKDEHHRTLDKLKFVI